MSARIQIQSWSWWVTRPDVDGVLTRYRCIDGPPWNVVEEHECRLPERRKPWACPQCGAYFELFPGTGTMGHAVAIAKGQTTLSLPA